MLRVARLATPAIAAGIVIAALSSGANSPDGAQHVIFRSATATVAPAMRIVVCNQYLSIGAMRSMNAAGISPAAVGFCVLPNDGE